MHAFPHFALLLSCSYSLCDTPNTSKLYCSLHTLGFHFFSLNMHLNYTWFLIDSLLLASDLCENLEITFPMDNIIWTGQAMLERLVDMVVNEEGDRMVFWQCDVRLDYCLEWCSLQALSKRTCKYATIPHFPHSTPNDSYALEAQPSSYSPGMTNHTPSHVSHNWSHQIKSPPSVKLYHAPSHMVSHDWVMTSSHDPNHQSQLWPFVVRPTHHPDMEQSQLVARWVIGSQFRSSSVQ